MSTSVVSIVRASLTGAAVMVLLVGQTAFAAVGPTLSLTSTTTCVQAGSDVPVTVLMSNGTDVSTVQTTLIYDPTILEVTSEPIVSSSFPLVFRQVVDPASGTIELSASNSSPVSGSVDFATISFRALRSNATQVTFDPNGTLILTSGQENTNVLAGTNPINLASCDGSSSGGGDGNSNGSTGGGSSGGGSAGGGNTSNNNGSSGGGGSLGGGSSGGGSSGGSTSGQCSQPTNFEAIAQGNSILLSWRYSDARLSHFVVHYGMSAAQLTTAFLANSSNTDRSGDAFRLMLSNLSSGKTYYLAISAMGNCQESQYTPVVSVQTSSSGGGSSGGGSSPTGGSGTSWSGATGGSSGTGGSFGGTTGGVNPGGSYGNTGGVVGSTGGVNTGSGYYNPYGGTSGYGSTTGTTGGTPYNPYGTPGVATAYGANPGIYTNPAYGQQAATGAGTYYATGANNGTAVLTNRGRQLNARLVSASGTPYSGPREAMLAAVLSAILVAGVWMGTRTKRDDAPVS